MSFLFWLGKMTLFIPLRCAAMHFSLMPPTGNARPYRLISPVIAKSERTRLPVKRETKATVIVTPALGPSFGVAAAGKCTCKSMFLKVSRIIIFSLCNDNSASATEN